MKKIVFYLCALLALASIGASAQTVTQPPSNTATAPIDPAIEAAVRELLTSIKYRDLMQASLAQMLNAMPAMLKQAASSAVTADGTLSALQKKRALEKIDKELPRAVQALKSMFDDPNLLDELTAEIVPLYARHFTAQEIHQMSDFYKTPVGVKMLATMPAILNDSMQISQRVMMPRVGRMIEKLSKVE